MAGRTYGAIVAGRCHLYELAIPPTNDTRSEAERHRRWRHTHLDTWLRSFGDGQAADDGGDGGRRLRLPSPSERKRRGVSGGDGALTKKERKGTR